MTDNIIEMLQKVAGAVDPAEAYRDLLVRTLADQLKVLVSQEHESVARILRGIREMAANENQLMVLFSLHVVINSMLIGMRSFSCAHEINQACAELSIDFAEFAFQKAAP